MSWPRSDHTVIHAPSSRSGGRGRSVRMFVSLTAFRSVAALIGEWAAWSGDGMRQRQPMRCAILLSHRPSLIPARRPCLYASAVLPVVSHSTRAVCSVGMCLLVQKFVCVVALTNLLKLPAPMSPLAEVQGEAALPLWKTPVLPLNPAALNATVPKPSWHLPWDALNELKEIQRDTWCSSHGTPLLLCFSAQLCPPAQAQRRTRHGTKNTQSAAVYQVDLSSSPHHNTPLNTFPYIPSANVWLFPLRLYTFWHLSDCRDGGNCKPRKRAKGHLCSLRGNFSSVDSLLHLIEWEWSHMG